MSYSQASQSHYSFCADSDLGLNTDLLYSDDISELISSQTPLTSTSQISSPIAPLSLTRVGLPLQQYWVLYSSEPSSEMEESRKRFISWWLTTESGSTPDIQDSIRWDGKKTSSVWDNFNQVAHEKTGKPKVMCISCLCTLVHLRYRRAGSSPMNAHIKAGTCTRKPVTQRVDQLLRKMPSIPKHQPFSQERLVKAILDFISAAHLPFRIVEHTQFKDLVEVIQQAQSKIDIPSARSIRLLKREFQRYKEILHRDSDNTVLQDTTREAPDDEYEVIKEYLSIGEAALLDQARKPMLHLETLEPISDNEEEDQEPSIQDTQQKRSCNDDSDDERNNDQSKQVQRKRSKKRLSESLDEDDDDLPEMPIDESMLGRSGRIRKQPRLPDGFQIDLR
ncbi:uncharacterized protein N7529_000007 [Penicillium soppii]|uniref:uncharacterized protein n=1 Tax=Penicillium soppii TaxID=69789 RepID=UPI002547BBCF|nr:uncharacterized protein N7529_000007 [Penicillium soppii]KAJ5881335.1 hypothetical protein N7529_000007 [Penicillium soppii]